MYGIETMAVLENTSYHLRITEGAMVGSPHLATRFEMLTLEEEIK